MESILDKTKNEELIDSSLLPFVSVIIPSFNNSQSLPLTIDSVIEQHYPRFEMIVIDAKSTDRTMDILGSYTGQQISLVTVETYNPYQMINQGITLAKGEYVNVLFPGDFYIHRHALLDIMQIVLSNQKPHLVYCGTLLRDSESLKFLFRVLTLELLKKGQQPTSLQACWFRKEVFAEIGYFRTDFELRGGFDFLCRFVLHKKFTFSYLRHALMDYDLRWVTCKMVIAHFWETFLSIYRFFGVWVLLKWLVNQRDFGRMIKLWLRWLKVAFIGR